MWESLFTYTGLNGYQENEEYAIYKANKEKVFPELVELAQNGDLEAIYLLAYAYSMGLNVGEKKLNSEYFPMPLCFFNPKIL